MRREQGLFFAGHRLLSAALLGIPLVLVFLQVPIIARARADTEGISVEDAFEQARHYYRRGLLKEAVRAVKRALSTEEGRQDSELQLLAAQIYRDRGEIDFSFRALTRARQHGDEGTRARADLLYRAMKKAFGEVRILTKGGVHVKGRIFLKSANPIINVQRKALFKGVQRSLLVKARRYPDSIWIPYGSYRANGARFEHVQGGRSEVEVFFPHIAVLRSRARPEDNKAALRAFKARVGGVVKVYGLRGSKEANESIVERLRKERPDLLVALGTEAALQCRRRLRRVPMLFGGVEYGWRPQELRIRAEACGVDFHPYPARVVERLHRLLPKLRRVAVLHGPRPDEDHLQVMKKALAKLSVAMVRKEMSIEADPSSVLTGLPDSLDALWLLPDPLFAQARVFERIRDHAIAVAIPLVVPSPELVRRGGLMALVVDPRATGAQLAVLARKVLFRQLSASDLEVLEPERLRWHLNRATARKIGLETDSGLLSDVDHVYSEPKGP